MKRPRGRKTASAPKKSSNPEEPPPEAFDLIEERSHLLRADVSVAWGCFNDKLSKAVTFDEANEAVAEYAVDVIDAYAARLMLGENEKAFVEALEGVKIRIETMLARMQRERPARFSRAKIDLRIVGRIAWHRAEYIKKMIAKQLAESTRKAESESEPEPVSAEGEPQPAQPEPPTERAEPQPTKPEEPATASPKDGTPPIRLQLDNQSFEAVGTAYIDHIRSQGVCAVLPSRAGDLVARERITVP